MGSLSLLVRCLSFSPFSFNTNRVFGLNLSNGLNQAGPHCDPDPDSPLSLWGHGYSVEIPARCTPSDSTNLGGFALPSVGLAAIDAESERRPPQEFIDTLDMVCSSTLVPPFQAKLSSRPWTTRHAIKIDTSYSTSCARCAVVTGLHPNQCM